MTQVTCEGCGTKYRVQKEFAGLRFRCKHCGKRFVAPGAPAKVANLPAWLRLREIDPKMIAHVIDEMRRKKRTGKSAQTAPLTAEQRKWQSLIAEMYGGATSPDDSDAD